MLLSCLCLVFASLVVSAGIRERLEKGMDFLLCTLEGGARTLPVTLVLVQDAFHPPPGAVYWVEQEKFKDGALELVWTARTRMHPR
jgi:hypothetical protein